jgi:hypothetical protein
MDIMRDGIIVDVRNLSADTKYKAIALLESLGLKKHCNMNDSNVRNATYFTNIQDKWDIGVTGAIYYVDEDKTPHESNIPLIISYEKLMALVYSNFSRDDMKEGDHVTLREYENCALIFGIIYQSMGDRNLHPVIALSELTDDMKSRYPQFVVMDIHRDGELVYQRKEEPEMVDVTLQDVAELKGVPVNRIRIIDKGSKA